MFAGAAAVAAAPVVAMAAKVPNPSPKWFPEIQPIELRIDSADIVTRNRKLKARWSVEAAEDLRSMHNIEAERELTAMLAKEINEEIDREILSDLLGNLPARHLAA